MDITETNLTTVEEQSKSQNIRLLDVFFIGPFMMYIGYKAKGISNLERYTLFALGVATIYYNGKNYIESRN